MDKITKVDENSVSISKTEETVVDFETLTAQKTAILAEQEREEQYLIAANAGRAMVLAQIEEALATGIVAKPEPVVEPVISPVEEVIQ